MHLAQALRSAYKSKGHSLRSWGELIGVTSGTLGAALGAGNITVATLLRYVTPLGYQVALVPAGSKLPEGSYLIDSAGPKPEPEPIDLDDPNLMLG